MSRIFQQSTNLRKAMIIQATKLVKICSNLHLKKGWPFIWSNLNPIYPMMLCFKFVKIGPVVLEKKILNLAKTFSLSSPLRQRVWPFIGQTWIFFQKVDWSFQLRWAKKSTNCQNEKNSTFQYSEYTVSQTWCLD